MFLQFLEDYACTTTKLKAFFDLKQLYPRIGCERMDKKLAGGSSAFKVKDFIDDKIRSKIVYEYKKNFADLPLQRSLRSSTITPPPSIVEYHTHHYGNDRRVLRRTCTDLYLLTTAFRTSSTHSRPHSIASVHRSSIRSNSRTASPATSTTSNSESSFSDGSDVDTSDVEDMIDALDLNTAQKRDLAGAVAKTKKYVAALTKIREKKEKMLAKVKRGKKARF